MELSLELDHNESMIGGAGAAARPRNHEGDKLVTLCYNMLHKTSIYYTYYYNKCNKNSQESNKAP